ncbi:hypothetical protein Taro_030032 [Colocasia esculenta]|uniref:U-box domain-containing protein n=1 Tax=Colocasia esculenta TaxID=4460 RepID=A0A843VFA8_COLES|nr:hypothetical protein [Colocasia esculenta]
MPGSVAPLDLALVQVPYHFRCPISLELMRDPVTISTGQTYDRPSIESWIATGNTTCPVTRAPLSDFTLIPNHTLRRLIQEWCVAHRSLGVERIPTPRQPADPALVRVLVTQAGSAASAAPPRLAALRRLRTLARDSDKDRLVISTPENRASLLSLAFDDAAVVGGGTGDSAVPQQELALESLSVVSMLPLSEEESASVASRPDRLLWIAGLLSSHPSAETRADAAAMIEAVSAGTRSPDLRIAIGATEGVMEGLVQMLDRDHRCPRAVKAVIKALFSLCLVKQNRERAVSFRAIESLIDRVASNDLDRGDLERALATVELLCRADGGCETLAAHAGTVGALVKVLSAKVSDRAAEHAAGALVAACGASEALQREAVAKGVVARLLLMVQSDCTERAKRKAQLLLKLLRAAWPQHDSLANSDDFQVLPLAAAPFLC